MLGRIALRNGILYVGRHEQTAHVRPYDLQGGALSEGISFRGPGGEACTLVGLDVDADHHVWIADRASERVRAFTLFGQEVRALAGAVQELRQDARGTLRGLTDLVLLPGEPEELELLVASGGWRRHGVQILRADGRWVASLRPAGDPMGRFRGACGLAALGRWIYVCEPRAGRIQVFRDREFHFHFQLPQGRAGRLEPVAVAPLSDGRMVVAAAGVESALLLLDAGGRLQRVLALAGTEPGQVEEPADVAVDETSASVRVAVIDSDAERVQVFTLEGQCEGALEDLA